MSTCNCKRCDGDVTKWFYPGNAFNVDVTISDLIKDMKKIKCNS